MHIICYREVHIRIVYDDDDDEYVVEMPLAVPTVQPSCQFGIEAISQLTWQVCNLHLFSMMMIWLVKMVMMMI